MLDLLRAEEKGVDDRIAHEVDPLFRNRFTQKIPFCPLSRN